MKTLKANQIEKKHLSEKEMQNAAGGNFCGCGCIYANNGGSSVASKGNANYDDNLMSDQIVRYVFDMYESW